MAYIKTIDSGFNDVHETYKIACSKTLWQHEIMRGKKPE